MSDVDSVPDFIQGMGRRAREASRQLAALSDQQKRQALLAMAAAVREDAPTILDANERDVAAARQRDLSAAMVDRLVLTPARVESMAAGIEKVASLPDPVGETLETIERPNGIQIRKVRVPIGVIGIIYESRPNVTSDAAVLCLRSGNATILRGGSNAIESNRAIAASLARGGASVGLHEHAIQLVPFTDRSSVSAMAKMDRYLDVIVPRGGRSLIEAVTEAARMPVIKHYDGICHAYVDAAADLDRALSIIDDGKTQKPSVCNALETVLIHESVADRFLPRLAERFEQRGVTVFGDERSVATISSWKPATRADWTTEYLDLKIAVRVVDGLTTAVEHINEFGSHHSEVIITDDVDAASRFLRDVDSACVFHNASTRFADGEEFGFGAEIGISTDRLHARGPMGLRELTTYKYEIRGAGQVKDAKRLIDQPSG